MCRCFRAAAGANRRPNPSTTLLDDEWTPLIIAVDLGHTAIAGLLETTVRQNQQDLLKYGLAHTINKNKKKHTKKNIECWVSARKVEVRA